MAMDPKRRARIVDAAAELFATNGVVNVGRHDIARAAGVTMRSVNAVGEHRVDLLREAVELLPDGPLAEALREHAGNAVHAGAMSTLLSAAHEVLGDPSAAWDPVELQALIVSPYDDALRGLMGARVERRWVAARELLRQLEIVGDQAGEEAAVLHLLAVGVGIAALAPVVPKAHDTNAWTALSARIIESLSEYQPEVDADPGMSHHLETRVWRARLTLPTGAGAIAHLTRVLSMMDVSPVTMTTAPVGKEGRESLVDLILRSSDHMTRAMVADALRTVGRDVVVGRGEADDGEDVAARVLELSTRLLAHPELAPRAAAELLLADSWEVVDASEGDDSSPQAVRLQWTVDEHVVVRRSSAPFTAGEYARASALLGLMDAVTVARGTKSFGWRDTLADGTEIVTRLARPEDTADVESLHSRCSTDSLFQRYFTPKNTWREENLRRISGGHRGITLIVEAHDSDVIAIGNAFPLTPDESQDLHVVAQGEIALLVDDAWHGRGIGRLLLRHLAESAPRLGFDYLVAFVLEDNGAMRSLLDPDVWQARPAPDLGASALAFYAPVSSINEVREPSSLE
jgi:GNAT superfamily N-acetyltransferase/AcrR family transcriptional regulator